MAQMRAWVLNGTWDANFVLASTDMIAAENKAASLLGAFDGVDGTVPSGIGGIVLSSSFMNCVSSVRAGGWVELDTVPFTLMTRNPSVEESTVDHSDAAFEVTITVLCAVVPEDVLL
jgi:hypothetical protein